MKLWISGGQKVHAVYDSPGCSNLLQSVKKCKMFPLGDRRTLRSIDTSQPISSVLFIILSITFIPPRIIISYNVSWACPRDKSSLTFALVVGASSTYKIRNCLIATPKSREVRPSKRSRRSILTASVEVWGPEGWGLIPSWGGGRRVRGWTQWCGWTIVDGALCGWIRLLKHS